MFYARVAKDRATGTWCGRPFRVSHPQREVRRSDLPSLTIAFRSDGFARRAVIARRQARIHRQLQYCRPQSGTQTGYQKDLPVGELYRIVMDVRNVQIDLTKATEAVGNLRATDWQ